MILTLRNTDKIVELDDGRGVVPARIWEGTTENGVRVVAFIVRVAVREGDDSTQFENELRATPPVRPSSDVAVIPTRLIL